MQDAGITNIKAFSGPGAQSVFALAMSTLPLSAGEYNNRYFSHSALELLYVGAIRA